MLRDALPDPDFVASLIREPQLHESPLTPQELTGTPRGHVRWSGTEAEDEEASWRAAYVEEPVGPAPEDDPHFFDNLVKDIEAQLEGLSDSSDLNFGPLPPRALRDSPRKRSAPVPTDGFGSATRPAEPPQGLVKHMVGGVLARNARGEAGDEEGAPEWGPSPEAVPFMGRTRFFARIRDSMLGLRRGVEGLLDEASSPAQGEGKEGLRERNVDLFEEAIASITEEVYGAFMLAGSGRAKAARLGSAYKDMAQRHSAAVDKQMRALASDRDKLERAMDFQQRKHRGQRHEWRRVILQLYARVQSFQRVYVQWLNLRKENKRLEADIEELRGDLTEVDEYKVKVTTLQTQLDGMMQRLAQERDTRRAAEETLAKERKEAKATQKRLNKEAAKLQEHLDGALDLERELKSWIESDAKLSMEQWHERFEKGAGEEAHREWMLGPHGFGKMMLMLTDKFHCMPRTNAWLNTFLPEEVHDKWTPPPKAAEQEPAKAPESAPAPKAKPGWGSLQGTVNSEDDSLGLKKLPRMWRSAFKTATSISKLVDNIVLPAKSVSRTIADIYREKHKADEVDVREGKDRQTMPEFVYEFLLTKYGLESLAEKNLTILIRSMNIYANPDLPANGGKRSLRVELFIRFCGISKALASLPVEACTAYVNLFDTIHTIKSGSALVELDDATTWVHLNRIKPSIAAVFHGALKERILGTLEKLPKGTIHHGYAKGMIDIDVLMEAVMEAWEQETVLGFETLTAAFREFDANGDGVFTLEEFTTLVRSFDPNATDRNIISIFREALEIGRDADAEEEPADTMTPVAFVKVARKHRLLQKRETALEQGFFRSYEALVEEWKKVEPELRQAMRVFRRQGTPFTPERILALGDQLQALTEQAEIRDAQKGWKLLEEVTAEFRNASDEHERLVQAVQATVKTSRPMFTQTDAPMSKPQRARAIIADGSSGSGGGASSSFSSSQVVTVEVLALSEVADAKGFERSGLRGRGFRVGSDGRTIEKPEVSFELVAPKRPRIVCSESGTQSEPYRTTRELELERELEAANGNLTAMHESVKQINNLDELMQAMRGAVDSLEAELANAQSEWDSLKEFDAAIRKDFQSAKEAVWQTRVQHSELWQMLAERAPEEPVSAPAPVPVPVPVPVPALVPKPTREESTSQTTPRVTPRVTPRLDEARVAEVEEELRQRWAQLGAARDLFEQILSVLLAEASKLSSVLSDAARAATHEMGLLTDARGEAVEAARAGSRATDLPQIQAVPALRRRPPETGSRVRWEPLSPAPPQSPASVGRGGGGDSESRSVGGASLFVGDGEQGVAHLVLGRLARLSDAHEHLQRLLALSRGQPKSAAEGVGLMEALTERWRTEASDAGLLPYQPRATTATATTTTTTTTRAHHPQSPGAFPARPQSARADRHAQRAQRRPSSAHSRSSGGVTASVPLSVVSVHTIEYDDGEEEQQSAKEHPRRALRHGNHLNIA